MTAHSRPSDRPPELPDLRTASDSFQEAIGQRLRWLRELRGLSLGDLERDFGLNRSQLSRAEAGKNALSVRTLVRIASAIGVDFSDVFAPDTELVAKRAKGRRGRRTADPDEIDARTQKILAQMGARLRELRTMQGLSYELLAEFTGGQAGQLRRYENGEVNMTARTLVGIADAIGVYPYELYLPREQSGIRPQQKRGTGSSR